AAENTFRARRADIVLAHDLEQRGAHHTRCHGGIAIAHRKRRPEERREIGHGVLEDRDIADLRQPSEDRDQAQHDDHAEPETRKGETGDGDDAHRVVDPGIAIERGYGAEGYGDQYGYERRHDGDLQRDGKAQPDLIDDVVARPERFAE